MAGGGMSVHAQGIEYVTAWIADQLFGIPIQRVHDVFETGRLTRVPLAQPEIAGVLNLRGRVVTAIDMRRRLRLPPRDPAKSQLAIGIDLNGEAYGLLVDAMGEVMKVPAGALDPNPINLGRDWAQVSNGVFRLEDRLLVVLDVDRILALELNTLAA
jgi:purine-binding chemotaxis protein CheW